MSFSKEFTHLPASSVKLTIKLDKDEVDSEYNDELSNLVKKIQLPGFRKGKVPKNIVEHKFHDAIISELTGSIIEKYVPKVFSDETIPAAQMPLSYSQPKLADENNLPKLILGEPFEFAITYDVFPDMELKKWTDYTVGINSAVITDEDIALELRELQERNSIVLDRCEGAPSQTGDVVTVTYCELDDAGVPIADTERQDFVFELGKGQNIYKFDVDITGMKAGEQREFTKTYPFEPEITEFAGQTKKFRLTMTAVKEKQLPDLDDEFAKDVDEKYKTLLDLKTSIKERLEHRLEHKLEELKSNAILEKIIEDNPVEIPKSMIAMELHSFLRRKLGPQAESERPEKLLDTEIGKALAPGIVKSLHAGLVINKIIETEKIEASPEDIEHKIEALAKDSNTEIDEVKKYYESVEARRDLEENIKQEKAYKLVVEKNKINIEKTVKFLELFEQAGENT